MRIIAVSAITLLALACVACGSGAAAPAATPTSTNTPTPVVPTSAKLMPHLGTGPGNVYFRPATDILGAGRAFDVELFVADVSNLAGYQFILSYDHDIVSATGVDNADFLTSTGREPQCVSPEIVAPDLGFTCVTLRMMPPGPTGSGTLARIHMVAEHVGSTELTLSKVKLVDPLGVALPSTSSNAELLIR